MPTVLVVENRPTDREHLVSLLGGSDYDVLETETGEEALRLTREWRPDLVIADMLVPDMDGLDLARAVRSDPSISGIPIILYAATYELWELEQLARAAGVSRVVRKPTDPRRSFAPSHRSLRRARPDDAHGASGRRGPRVPRGAQGGHRTCPVARVGRPRRARPSTPWSSVASTARRRAGGRDDAGRRRPARGTESSRL